MIEYKYGIFPKVTKFWNQELIDHSSWDFVEGIAWLNKTEQEASSVISSL